MKKFLIFLCLLSFGMMAYGQNCYTNNAPAALNVRKTPATNGAVIGTLPVGQEVTVVVINGDWAVINWNNGIAYVAAKFISPCSAKTLAVEKRQPVDTLKNNPMYKKAKRIRDAGIGLTSCLLVACGGGAMIGIGKEQMKVIEKYGTDIYSNEQYLKAKKKRDAGAFLTGFGYFSPIGIPLLVRGQKQMNRILQAEYEEKDSTAVH